MTKNKKIILNYITIFFVIVISSYFIVNKLVTDTLKKDDLQKDDFLVIKISSNYENYSFRFRSDQFFEEINTISPGVTVTHELKDGKHNVGINVLNANYEAIDKFKKIITNSLNLYKKDFDNCIDNFKICKNYHLKDEVIKYILFKNRENTEKKIDQLSCLINSNLTDCRKKTIFLIKDHFEPIKVGYNFFESKKQDKKENKKKIFLVTNSIMILFIVVIFIISSPILILLTKKRL